MSVLELTVNVYVRSQLMIKLIISSNGGTSFRLDGEMNSFSGYYSSVVLLATGDEVIKF